MLVAQVAGAAPDEAHFSGEVARQIAHNHGSHFSDVIDIAREDPRLAVPYPGTSVVPAQVVHAVRAEMAHSLEDVLQRRTDLGTAEAPSDAALDAVARDVAEESGWDEARTRAEVEEARSFFSHRGATREFGHPPTEGAA
jgi:glycerol-3-phosphate dehydrogenase